MIVTMKPLVLACVICANTHLLGEAATSRGSVEIALENATGYLRSISTEGGYLWSYSADLEQRWGETKATPSQIWVQPPGTPTVGMALLRAWKVTGNSAHLKAAEAAALALARGQLDSGGWDYVVEFDPKSRRQWAYREIAVADRPSGARRNTTTFDDDNTQSALRFLLAYLAAAKNQGSGSNLATIRATADYGLTRMIEAQYPNGAWPQRFDGERPDLAQYPIQAARYPTNWSRTWTKPRYSGFYTFNDHAQRQCILTMLAANRHLGERKFLESAHRGGEFILRAQMPEPQPAWAQQYNFAMEPDWARAFEPPAISSAESAGILRTLADLYLATGDPALLKPVPAAVAWYRRSQLGPNLWARFYELGTNTPIYGDRDGKIHYRLEEISAERRSGYAWQGSFGIPEAIAYAEDIQRRSREKPGVQSHTSPTPGGSMEEEGQIGVKPKPPSEREIKRLLETQEKSGRWLTRNRVEMRTFIRNMGALCDYLEHGSKP